MFNTNDIITDYVNRFFDVKLGSEILIVNTFDDIEMPYSEFMNHIQRMFAINNLKVIHEWYGEEIRKKLGDFYEYLEKCRVELGATNWVVYDDFGMEVTTEKLTTFFGSTLSPNIIQIFYDKWYDDALIKHTEKIMGFKL